MLVIRSNAGTRSIENFAERCSWDWFSYLNREQLWLLADFQRPLFTNAPVVGYKNGSPIYKRDDKTGKYVIIDDQKGTIPVYDSRFTTIFPRMWSSERSGSESVFQGLGRKRCPIKVTKCRWKTSYPEWNLHSWKTWDIFFQYQVGVMYFVISLWNFAGRSKRCPGLWRSSGWELDQWDSLIDRLHYR